MSDTVKVEKVTINLGDTELTITIEQARQLYRELETIFGGDRAVIVPVYPHYPTYPYYPNYPTYPIITISATTETTGGIVYEPKTAS